MEREAPGWLKADATAQAARGGAQEASRVLFVCTGNICRSAFSEAYLRSLVGDAVIVESAGIGAVVGHGMDDRAAVLAARQGADPAPHRARQLTGRILRDATLVVVFGPEHEEWILENHPEARGKTVAIGQLAALAEAGGEKPAVADAARRVRELELAPGQSPWVEDPYRTDDAVYAGIMQGLVVALDRVREAVAW